MRKVIVVILAVMALVVGMVAPAMAATFETVVITADPAYITFAQAITTWKLNDIVGDGVTPKGYVAPDTIYYATVTAITDGTPPSATVLDAECRFTVDPAGSSLHMDFAVNCGNFTGGGATMTNSGDGTNGATTFGGYSYASGATYGTVGAGNKTIMKETGSLNMKIDNGEATTFKWGAQIETRTNAWASSGASTANMVITATAHPP